MKTRGTGMIQAWPFWNDGGAFAKAEYALEETGAKLKLDHRLRAWEVLTTHGARLVIPFDIAVVTWGVVQPTKLTNGGADSAGSTENRFTSPLVSAVFAAELDRARKLQIAPPPVLPTPYNCPFCKNAYALRVDAEVCKRHCNPKVGPFKGGSCKKCGYPYELHDGVKIEQGPDEEVTEVVQTTLREEEWQRVKHKRPTWIATVLESSGDSCRLLVDGAIEIIPHLRRGGG